MFVTLFLNTYCSSTRVKWGIWRKYNDTALTWRRSWLCSKPILSLASQNILTKTLLRHFPIIYEAVNETFMLDITHRNTPTPLSGPHISINSGYTTICKFSKSKTDSTAVIIGMVDMLIRYEKSVLKIIS